MEIMLMKRTSPEASMSIFLLTACGGGGGGSTGGGGTDNGTGTGTGVPATRLASTPQVIDYYGDSTIRGYAPFTGAQVSPTAPDEFRSTLASSGAAGQTVRNLGV